LRITDSGRIFQLARPIRIETLRRTESQDLQLGDSPVDSKSFPSYLQGIFFKEISWHSSIAKFFDLFDRKTGSFDCRRENQFPFDVTRVYRGLARVRQLRMAKNDSETDKSISRAFPARWRFVPRQLRTLYFTCSELLRAHYEFTRTRAATSVRVSVCGGARVRAESLTLGAHGSHNALYGHYGHCETRERMNMCTMHQRVKAQWRTTQTPELRRQSA